MAEVIAKDIEERAVPVSPELADEARKWREPPKSPPQPGPEPGARTRLSAVRYDLD